MGRNILAIDQGTTNTKALIIDPAGRVLARGSRPTAIDYPQPGWVEQDGLEVWRCTREAIDACLGALDDPNLVAVAVTNQRETSLVWERETGKPVWQCRRTIPFCNELKAQGVESLLQERTGLQVDPMFSASKIRWILEHTADGFRRAEQGELCAGNIDAWILWNLTGGAAHATDMTNASRTQLLNLRQLEWDADALDIFGIPQPVLPEVKPSSHIYGETVPIGGLPGGIPIACLIGDSHASLYGLGGFKPGSIKTTYGTGSSLMTPTGGGATSEPVISQNGLSTTIAWARERATYALEGNIYATGAAVQWTGHLLGMDDPGPGVEELARTVEDAGGVYFVPALVGLGAPHWKESALGVITGLTRGVGAGHLARATLEAITYQVRDVFDVMQAESGRPLQTLLADGGGSRNDLLVQLQADIINCPVLRSTSKDVSPLGAAYLAGLAIGLWADEAEIETLVPQRDRFEPQMVPEQREAMYAGWQQAVARTVFDPGM